MSKYHYVYRITNTQEKKQYYGVRSSKVEPKSDLGIKYFSSSSDKDFIKGQKENKSIFKYKVVKIFETRVEAINLEIKLHSKFNVGIDESFYNKSKQTSTGFDTSGTTYSHTEEAKEKIRKYRKTYKHTEETLQKMSLSLSGRVFSDEHIEKLKIAAKNREPMPEETKQKISDSISGCNHHLFGKTHTEETKQKMSLSQKGENNGMFGKTHTEETKRKISKPKPQAYIICPYCNKYGGASNMKRYHFDNCKLKT